MEHSYEVKITRQAMDQMKEISFYISKSLLVPEIANQLLDKIKAAIISLSSFPKKHALVEEEPWRSAGIRRLVVNNFLIYFWIDEEKFKVQVTAVIYNKRNQIQQLTNMDLS